jgi:hypothetical protein
MIHKIFSRFDADKRDELRLNTSNADPGRGNASRNSPTSGCRRRVREVRQIESAATGKKVQAPFNVLEVDEVNRSTTPK